MLDLTLSSTPLILPKEVDITAQVSRFPAILELFAASSQAKYFLSPVIKRRLQGKVLKKKLTITCFSPQKQVATLETEYGGDELVLLTEAIKQTGLWSYTTRTFNLPALSAGRPVTLKWISPVPEGLLLVNYSTAPTAGEFVDLTDLSNETIAELKELVEAEKAGKLVFELGFSQGEVAFPEPFVDLSDIREELDKFCICDDPLPEKIFLGRHVKKEDSRIFIEFLLDGKLVELAIAEESNATVATIAERSKLWTAGNFTFPAGASTPWGSLQTIHCDKRGCYYSGEISEGKYQFPLLELSEEMLANLQEFITKWRNVYDEDEYPV